MTRKPTIHTDEKGLLKTLTKVFDDTGVDLCGLDINDLVDDIMKVAKKYTVASRNLDLKQKETREKLNKVASGNVDTAYLFLKTLYLIRRKKYHKHFKTIEEGDKEYLTIKQAVGKAETFCENYKITYKEGFYFYITEILERTNFYNTATLVSMGERVGQIWEAKEGIKEDAHVSSTKLAYNTYRQKIISKTGVTFNYDNDPEKYVTFVKVAYDCREKLKCNVTDYIEAQFDAFEWKSGIPNLWDLIGDKAVERFAKYCYKNSISLKASKETANVDWKKIKRMKDEKRKS